MYTSINPSFTIHCIKVGFKGVKIIYRIRPNYRTVRLNFSKALGKLAVKYPSNKGTLERKSNRGLHEEHI